MKELYIIYRSLAPNSAPTNRFLSFVKGFDELGVKTHVIFITPDNKLTRLNEKHYTSGISVHYLWQDKGYHNRYIKLIRSFFDVNKFVKEIPSGSSVFLVGCVDYLFLFTRRSDLRIYHERTEHPDVVRALLPFSQKRYLHACKKASGIFVISTHLKAYFESIGCRNVNIINMTVDSSRFKDIKKQAGPYPYIAYCGTASNNKDGVDELIKSFAIVHEKYPQYKLKIMGKAPTKGDESGNLGLVNLLGLNDSVIFTGLVKSTQMPTELKNAEILALDRPSSLQATCGFPTKLGEYLLTENPVVVTKVGDIPLFLKDEENALLSDERNPDMFASKLIWAIEHPAEARVIGKNGAETALCNFNNVVEAQKILDVIFES